jgi:hypothetical protein
MTTCRCSLFSLLLAAHYQPAAFRFRQKSSVRAASGDTEQQEFSLFRRCFSLFLHGSESAKNVQRPKISNGATPSV